MVWELNCESGIGKSHLCMIRMKLWENNLTFPFIPFNFPVYMCNLLGLLGYSLYTIKEMIPLFVTITDGRNEILQC